MKVYVETYGCQMNVADSDAVSALLESDGHEMVADERDADVIVLNTCSVRERAEVRVIGRLGELSREKRRRDVRFIVAGCMAQRMGKRLIERMPCVDLVVGPDDLVFLPELLRSGAAGVVIDSLGDDSGREDAAPRGGVCAFVPVARGCDNFCSYCVVPFVRGRERCRPFETVVRECEKLAERGAVEATLLGQNVNSYRDGDRDFADLVRAVDRTSGLKRVRFMTSHPKDLSDRLIAAIAECGSACEHVHLPLQAGHDRTLERMNRGYTVERYVALVERLRDGVLDVALTTDVIVGFPGETEAEFEATLDVVRAIRFDSAFTFRYSAREGTAAARYVDDVPEEEKIARLRRLIELQRGISRELYQRRVGGDVQVLVDAKAKRGTDRLRGRTRGHHTVLFPGDDGLIGKFVDVRVTGADSFTLFGERA